MLEMYNIDSNGVIYQKNPTPFEYNQDYIEHYRVLDYKYTKDSFELNQKRFKFIEGNISLNILKPLKILDYGFGSGTFITANSHKNIDWYCFDVVENPVVPKEAEFISNPFKDSYDVVCFHDSLEHLKDPYDVVERLKTKYISVSLPWCPSEYPNETFMNWKHRKPNEHLFHFNHKSLIKFFENLGYECLGISNYEDAIRQSEINKPNILSGFFQKV